MSERTFNDLFHQLPLVGILRGFRTDQIASIVEASLEGGLTNVEITMNTDGAAEQIRAAIAASEDRMNVGAGTVTSRERLDAAIEAGATFIVTPAVIPEVIDRCVDLKVPVFPGALTPTEIWQAWDARATMVKLFPADLGGPSYVKSIKAPFPDIPLMATGGVTLDTIGAFMRSGVDGFGLGSPLYQRERIEAGDWDWLSQHARKYRQAYHSHQG